MSVVSRLMKIRSKLLLLLLVTPVLMGGCVRDHWYAFVYPNRYDLNNYRYLGEFESLPECRGAAVMQLSRTNRLERGDYECGLNCSTQGGLRVRVCETYSR